MNSTAHDMYTKLGVFAHDIYYKLFKLIFDHPGKFTKNDIYGIAWRERWRLPNGALFNYQHIVEILQHENYIKSVHSRDKKKSIVWTPTQDGIDAFFVYEVEKDMLAVE